MKPRVDGGKPKPKVTVKVPPREVAKYQPSPKSKLNRALKPIRQATPNADAYDRQTKYGTKPNPPQAPTKLSPDQYDRATHYGKHPQAAQKIVRNVDEGKHRDDLHALDLLHASFDNTKSTSHRLAAARTLRTKYGFPLTQSTYINGVTPKLPKPKTERHGLLHDALHAILNSQDSKNPALNNGTLNAAHAVGGYALKLADSKNPIFTKPDQTSRAIGETIAHPVKAFKGAARSHAEQSAATAPGGSDAIVGAANVAKATVEHPGKVLGATAKSIPNIAAGLLAAPVEAAMDPVKAGKALKQDLGNRYGKNAGKVVQQQGLLPYALDVATVATPLGRGLGKVAKEGALGERAARVMADRPNLRVGAESVPQKVQPNFFKAAAGKIADVSREKAAARRAKNGNIRAVEPRPVGSNRLPQTNEVVHVFNRNATRQVRRQFATVRGRGTQMMSHEKRQVLDKFFKDHVNQLSKDQKEHGAFRYALEHGIHTPEAAREFLPVLRQMIVENRGHREDLFKLDHQHWVENGKRGIEPKLPKRVEDELPHIDHLIKHPELFDSKLRGTVIQARELGKSLGLSDPAMYDHVAQERALTPQQVLLKKAGVEGAGPKAGSVLNPVATMKDGESLADFKARAAEARNKAGLAEPGYFPHHPFVKPRLSDLTHGAAAKGAIKGAEQTKYDLFSHGEAATNTHALYNAYARNIKRKYNWNFVANTVKDFSLSHLYDKQTGEAIPTEGVSLGELEAAVQKSGVTGVRYYHPGKILAGAPDTELTLHDMTTMKDRYNKATTPGDFKEEKGWYLIPEEVHKEMEATVRWNGFTGRLFSKSKSFSSRVILGLNPSWAMIQVASNAMMATLGGVHPGDWAAARKYLTPEMRDAIRPYTQSYAFEGDRHSVHFGASAPRGMNEVLQYLHAMHDSPGGMGKFMRGAQKANPLDVLFRMDAAQNAFFREAVAWSKIKHDAYANMGHGMGGALRAYDKLRTAKGQDAIYNLLTDPKYLEGLASHVDEMLGNWTTFTAKERLTLQNNVMFYGFLRYSMRLLFWTMPAKHPIMLNVGVSLSRMHEQEVRHLLGAGPNDPLPFGALASVYYKKQGKLYQMNFARLNPAMNALVSAQDPASAITGVVPPLWAELGQQVSNLNFFKRMPFRVNGNAAPVSPLHWGDIALGTRLRIAGEHFLQLAAPYRVAEQIKFAGQPQGEDSMLMSPRPVQHTSVAGILKDLNAQDQAKKRGTIGTLLKSQVPILPQQSQDDKVTLQLKRAQQKQNHVPLTPQEQVQDLKQQVTAPNFAKNYVAANIKAAKIKTDREMKKNQALIKRIKQQSK